MSVIQINDDDDDDRALAFWWTVCWFVHSLCLCLTQIWRIRVPAIHAWTVDSALTIPVRQRVKQRTSAGVEAGIKAKTVNTVMRSLMWILSLCAIWPIYLFIYLLKYNGKVEIIQDYYTASLNAFTKYQTTRITLLSKSLRKF